jgi:hypothetical protein
LPVGNTQGRPILLPLKNVVGAAQYLDPTLALRLEPLSSGIIIRQGKNPLTPEELNELKKEF